MCGYWQRLTVRSVVDLHKNRQSQQEPTEFILENYQNMPDGNV